MSQAFDASRSLTALEQDSTIIAVIEMSQAKWLVAAATPRSRGSSGRYKHCTWWAGNVSKPA